MGGALSLFAARNPEVGACACSTEVTRTSAPIWNRAGSRARHLRREGYFRDARRREGAGSPAHYTWPASRVSHVSERPARVLQRRAARSLRPTASPRQTPGPRPSPSSGASCGLRIRWRVALVGTGVAAAAALPRFQPASSSAPTRRALYPRLQSVLTPVSNHVPFALFDALVAIVAGGWLVRRRPRYRAIPSSMGASWRAACPAHGRVDCGRSMCFFCWLGA